MIRPCRPRALAVTLNPHPNSEPPGEPHVPEPEAPVFPAARPARPPATMSDPISSPTAESTRSRPAGAELVFAEELCKGCELCITICPTKILKLDLGRVNSRGYHPAIIYNLTECSGCMSCAKICPDSVITVRR
jgi:2-oxoglutarate ferredoxin oxidoreductase subunit delta